MAQTKRPISAMTLALNIVIDLINMDAVTDLPACVQFRIRFDGRDRSRRNRFTASRHGSELMIGEFLTILHCHTRNLNLNVICSIFMSVSHAEGR